GGRGDGGRGDAGTGDAGTGEGEMAKDKPKRTTSRKHKTRVAASPRPRVPASAAAAAASPRPRVPASAAAAAPLVAVIMGSKTDWETMRYADEMLRQFDVPHECRVISAHRTPQLAAEFASTAE